MTLVVGTDEAGYGPNLGPLVVAATAWRVAAPPDEAERVLDRAVAAAAAAATAADGAAGPLWADSKAIHKPGAAGDGLARGVAIGLAVAAGSATPREATAAATGAPPATVADLADVLGGIAAGGIAAGGILPRGGSHGMWHALAALPAFPPGRRDPPAAAAAVARALADHGVRLARIACRGVYPDEFNAALDAGLNKSDLLSQATLDLAAGLVAAARATSGSAAADEPVLVWCDRHGGRKRYGGLVARHFDAPLVRGLEETPRRSVYMVAAREAEGRPACRVEFCVGGESRPPVALASMVAKHVRELAMEAFNACWSGRLPGLRPTAGYPTDAVRWRADAAAAIDRAGIAADDLWRRA
jgi:hypothetical protein